MANSPKYPVATRDAIKAVRDTREEWVDVDAWEMSVQVRSLSKGMQQKLRFEATKGGKLDENLLELLLVVEGVVQPKLEREDIADLREKSAEAIDTILGAAVGASEMDDKSAEEAEKNFRP